MSRRTATLDVRVEPDLIERIDIWRARQPVPPSRSATIVHMIEDFLDREAGMASLLARFAAEQEARRKGRDG
jgi:predicted transcriptional regulator